MSFFKGTFSKKPEHNGRYIAFSVWGDQPMYTIGAIRNVELAKKIYKGWEVIIYYNHSVPVDIIKKLRESGAIVKDMSSSGIYGLFWRFLAVDIPDCQYAIFRDTDSRLSIREKMAVDEWIRNGDVLHVMRDHPYHEVPFGANGLSILGGMWGMRGGIVPMTRLISDFIQSENNKYGLDQSFTEHIYQQFKHSQTVHDEFFEKKPFPKKRKNYTFIGERIDEKERPVGKDRDEIKKYYEQTRPSLFKKLTHLFVK